MVRSETREGTYMCKGRGNRDHTTFWLKYEGEMLKFLTWMEVSVVMPVTEVGDTGAEFQGGRESAVNEDWKCFCKWFCMLLIKYPE